MKVSNWLSLGFALCALPVALLGCGGGGSSLPEDKAASVKAWLEAGSYKSWNSDPKEVAAVEISPHKPFNRIFANEALSANADGKPFPKGAAAVKEIYDAEGGKIVGYAYYRKVQDDSAEGMGWYYYEEFPFGMQRADGLGVDGCVMCHKAAGMDDTHLANVGAHDYVYRQVK